jgi:CheY-like chemotaxis protein
MTSTNSGGFRLAEQELRASALRSQVLERCHRTLKHDINNVVQSMHSGLELLSKSVASPANARISAQDCLALLQQQLRTLRETLDRILQQLGQPPGAPERFDFSALLNEALTLLRHEHAVATAVTSIEPAVSVEARRANVRTFVLALLLDAIDHSTPDAKIEVRVRRIGEEPKARALLEVRAGVLDATADRPLLELLEPLLQDEQGELHVAQDGEQTSVTLELPSPAQAADAASSAVSRGGPMRVLIADRNRDAADSLAMILKLEGLETQVLYDGKQLAGTLAGFAPDVVLVDAALGNVNLLDVVRAAKRTLGAQVFFAVVSSSNAPVHPEIDAQLLRPIEWPQLKALLARVRR